MEKKKIIDLLPLRAEELTNTMNVIFFLPKESCDFKKRVKKFNCKLK